MQDLEKDRHAGLTSQTHPPPIPLRPNTDVNAQAILHQLCDQCLYIARNSQILRYDIIPPDESSKESFTHYETTKALGCSMRQGCHLCTLIIGTVKAHIIYNAVKKAEYEIAELSRDKLPLLDSAGSEPIYKLEIEAYYGKVFLRVVFGKIIELYGKPSPMLRLKRYDGSSIPFPGVVSGRQ